MDSSVPIPTLVRRIDALLPQTQCTRCGYPSCLDYAQAIVTGDAEINQCPPGGARGIATLAALLGRAPKPLNPNNGIETPAGIAIIDEAACIGCTKCIQVCPVDAIVGAAKLMHTVIAGECDGCELCIPACPVDCITMLKPAIEVQPMDRAPQYRRRYEARLRRLAREREQRDAGLAARKDQMHAGSVREAIARARAKKAAIGKPEA